MMITLFSAGGESTASLIGSAAYLLATRADVQDELRARPDLLGPFLEEVLRYEPPFRGHYRHVVNDTELCGAEFGWPLPAAGEDVIRPEIGQWLPSLLVRRLERLQLIVS